MSDPTSAAARITAPDRTTNVDDPAVTTQPQGEQATGPAPGGDAPRSGGGKPRSLWSDAWQDLRRKPLFIISAVLILFFLVLAAFPSLFTSVDPTTTDLSKSLDKPSADAWFGVDLQGADIYARTIHGARASIVVGVLAMLGTTLFGGLMGILAGYYGGWYDAILSRLGDIFFALPFVLGAIVILFTFNPAGSDSGPIRVVTLVVISLVVLGWPAPARIMRSAVISTKEADYVQAARALGAGPLRIIVRHILPNCLAPTLVYATISLGAFIGAEATLSFLGIGLRQPVVSWGVMISDARPQLRAAPHLLLFPAGFLTLAVLSFVMLGDAIREALDPKLR